LGAVYQGYNHVLQYQSELGAIGSPVAWLFNPLAFGLSGLLIIAFSYGLYRGGAGKIGSTLSAIAGLAFIWFGIWPLGPGLTFQMHMLGFYWFAASITLAGFAFSVSMKRSERWRSLWRYALFFAVLGLVILVIHMAGVFEPMHGLTQRMWGWTLNVWGLIMAVKLYRISQS
jgi:hypothetical membrane protein